LALVVSIAGANIAFHLPQGYIIMKKYHVPFSLAILLVATISGCGMKQQVQDTQNVAVSVLDDSIQKMSRQSDGWKDVLQETRDKLIKEGQSTLANEVSNVISRASSDAGIEVKCSVDFLRDRSKEELIKLRATLTKEKLELKPVFCNPTPNAIDMNLPPERRNGVEISGYNLTTENIKVSLLDSKAQTKVDVSSHLSNPSGYLLTLNLGGNGVPISPNSDKIIFDLPNAGARSIEIRQPVAPPPKPVFNNARIHVFGTIDMLDKENIGSDEHKSVTVDQWIDVNSGQNIAYNWEDCVGGEVQGYYNAQMQLDRNTGIVSIQPSGKYYEGTSCGRTDDQGTTIPANFQLSPGEQHTHAANRLEDGDGHMFYNLTFKYEN
jgi:hypothetical protein